MLKNKKLAEELELIKHGVGKGKTFEPASAHKRFDSESIVMKQIYKNLQPSDYEPIVYPRVAKRNLLSSNQSMKLVESSSRNL
jgi:hypothetical protein